MKGTREYKTPEQQKTITEVTDLLWSATPD